MKILGFIAVGLTYVAWTASNFIDFADKDGNLMVDEAELIAYYREWA